MAKKAPLKPTDFTIPLIKNLPYVDIVKAVPRFVSDDKTRPVLHYVTFRGGNLHATNGHTMIAASAKDWPDAHKAVEGALYTMSVVKDQAFFTPATLNNQFPNTEMLLKLPPVKESFVEHFNVGDYLGISRYSANSSLTDLAYFLNRQDYKIHLHYLSQLPLEQSYTVQARRAEPSKGGLGPVHFFNDAVHCILMPLRK